MNVINQRPDRSRSSDLIGSLERIEAHLKGQKPHGSPVTDLIWLPYEVILRLSWGYTMIYHDIWVIMPWLPYGYHEYGVIWGYVSNAYLSFWGSDHARGLSIVVRFRVPPGISRWELATKKCLQLGIYDLWCFVVIYDNICIPIKILIQKFWMSKIKNLKII